MKLVLVVACALINSEARVLLAERPAGRPMAGLWEFPGGKVEEGERPEQTLIRELREELGIAIEESWVSPLTFASHTYPTFHLLMPLYTCRRWNGAVDPQESQRVAWVRPDEIDSYKMPEADLPLLPHLEALLGPRPQRDMT